MKNLKKIVSVIVMVAMLISSFAAVSVFAADYADVNADNSYYKAIKVLSGLGVVKGDDEGNFNPTNDIKRSEMVALICRALGEEAVAQSSGGSSFDDVAADHWAAGYIAWGVAGNIVNGVGDNKFDPDASVKFQDAVVMVLRALGYERIAQRPENGGYPTGYLKVASQKGVLAGASFDGAKAATREVVAQVIYNGLTTPLVDVSYYAPNPADDEYVVYDGRNDTDLRTLLTYKSEIYKVKAIVNNTAKTDETLRKDIENPKVELNIIGTYDYAWDEILNNEFSKTKSTIKPYAGATDVADYLGYTVEAYIAENDDAEWELLAVVVDSKATVSETISENFEAYTDGKFEYYADENDAKTTKIDTAKGDELSVYYNGSLVPDTVIENVFGSLENLLVNYANSITFMGPKNDVYNKIFVTDYAYRQVDSVKADDLFVKFSAKGALTLDAEERGNESFLYNLYDAEGNAITLAEVEEGDIFNIVAPLYDGKKEELDNVPYMDIYVTDTTVTGAVEEEIIKDVKYTIAGEVYALDSNASVKVGDEGIFYITIDGLVYGADAASVINKNYSFIVAYGSDESFGVTTYELKLFTADNAVETYTVAPTLKVFEGDVATTYKRSDASQDTFFGKVATKIADAADEDAAKAKLAGRVVVYKTNSTGEISELRFAANGADFSVSNAMIEGKYDADTQVFAKKYDVNDATKLFVAPVTKIADGKYNVEEEGLAIASFSALDEDEDYSAFTFNFDGDDFLGAAVLGKEIEGSMKNAHLAVVKAMSTGLDADGSSVRKYTFVQGGDIITLSVDYDKAESIPALSIGDVFRYTVNGENEINKAALVYDVSEDKFNTKVDEEDYKYDNLEKNDIALVFGKVITLKDGTMTLDTEDVGEIRHRLNETEGNTYADVTVAKLAGSNPSTAVVARASSANIKESYSNNNYYVVAIVGETGRFEDCVQFIK